MSTYPFTAPRSLLVSVLLLAIGLSACTPPTPLATPTFTPPPTNTPTLLPPPEKPVMDPQGETSVEAGKTVAISANSTGAFTYEWDLQGKGDISDSSGPAVIYTAPESGETIAVVTVTAFNAEGAPSAASSLTINVAAKPVIVTVPIDGGLGLPTGWMIGKENSDPATYKTYISMGASQAKCHTDSDCLQIIYKPSGMFGGIFWFPESCGKTGSKETWDNATNGTCSINVLETRGLSVVQRLTFWARGSQGEEVVQFKVGASDLLPSPGRLSQFTLTSTWEAYEINLESVDLTKAVGLFAWIVSDASNLEGAVFYLDDIQYEGSK